MIANYGNNLPHLPLLTVVAGAYPPTGLSAEPDDLGNIKVSWTPPTLEDTMTGYQIFYKALGSGNIHESVPVCAGEDRHTLPNLEEGFVYTITMVTKSQHLPSTVAGPITATLGKRQTEAFCSMSLTFAQNLSHNSYSQLW